LTRAPFANWLGFAFANAMTWMIALGTPMVLLAGELGASTFEVGIAYASVFIVLPIQILATSTLHHFGYKWQMIFGWGSRGLFLTIPLGLAILAPTEPDRWMVLAMVGSVILFTFFRALGSCATWPWMYALIPDTIRGRYFATDQILTGVAGVLTLVFCGLLFTFLPTYEAYTWQYSFALVGSAISVIFLISIPDAPKPERIHLRSIISGMPAWILKPGGFRTYLHFMLLLHVVITSIAPFTVYFLKVERDIPFEHILFLSAIQYSGSIIASLWIRKSIDREGAKRAFIIGFGALGLNLAMWALIVQGNSSSFHDPAGNPLRWIWWSQCLLERRSHEIPALCLPGKSTRPDHLHP
jgi:MFS family permease